MQLSLLHRSTVSSLFFFFNDTATTEIYTLSLHDALPIWPGVERGEAARAAAITRVLPQLTPARGRSRPSLDRVPVHQDRKSTRLNSSHSQISYAVFCLKKKKRKQVPTASQQTAEAGDPYS